MPKKVVFAAALVLFVMASGISVAQRPEPEIHGEFQGDKMYTLLPPNGIPALMAPEYLTGEGAAAQMSADEPVMGLAGGGDAVCWSTWQLDHHEIVNDVFNGRAIAATW